MDSIMYLSRNKRKYISYARCVCHTKCTVIKKYFDVYRSPLHYFSVEYQSLKSQHLSIFKKALQMIKATVLAITGTRSFFTKLGSLPARPLFSAASLWRCHEGEISACHLFIL